MALMRWLRWLREHLVRLGDRVLSSTCRTRLVLLLGASWDRHSRSGRSWNRNCRRWVACRLHRQHRTHSRHQHSLEGNHARRGPKLDFLVRYLSFTKSYLSCQRTCGSVCILPCREDIYWLHLTIPPSIGSKRCDHKFRVCLSNSLPQCIWYISASPSSTSSSAWSCSCWLTSGSSSEGLACRWRGIGSGPHCLGHLALLCLLTLRMKYLVSSRLQTGQSRMVPNEQHPNSIPYFPQAAHSALLSLLCRFFSGTVCILKISRIYWVNYYFLICDDIYLDFPLIKFQSVI